MYLHQTPLKPNHSSTHSSERERGRGRGREREIAGEKEEQQRWFIPLSLLGYITVLSGGNLFK